MDKVLKRIIGVFTGFLTLGGVGAFFTTEMNDGGVAYVIMPVVFGVATVLLFRNPKQKTDLNKSEKKIDSSLMGERTFSHEDAILDPRVSMYLAQFDNGIRIIQDCMEIIQSTHNFDTFFMRKELSYEKLQTLREDCPNEELEESIREFQRSFETLMLIQEAEFLHRSFDKLIESVDSVKTDKAKLRRFHEYMSLMERYRTDFHTPFGLAEYEVTRQKVLSAISYLEEKTDV